MKIQMLEFFKSFTRVVWQTFVKADLSLLATSLAFSTIFALVPILSVFMAVSQWAGNFSDIAAKMQSVVLNYVAAGAGTDLVEQLSQILTRVEPAGLGVIGFLGLLFTSTKMIYDLDSTIVRIWAESRDTRWWKRISIYLVILLVFPVLIPAAMAFVDFEKMERVLPLFLNSGSVLLLVLLFVSFKYTPPVKISFRAALVGTLFTYVCLMVGKDMYVWTTRHLFNYDKIYGSLAFLPLLLFWLFILWCLILFGFTVTKAAEEAWK